jgi:histidinol dehydrogenase
VGIDFVAGPTEILLISWDGDPRHLAADMLAQAEHDVDSAAILLTTSKRLAARVAAEIEKQLATLPTAATAKLAIARNSAAIVTRSLDEAVEISNRFAPEHLSIPDESLLPKIENAGSIFIGPSSPEAAGDYAAGPNHVLPTSGAAALRGGLSVLDYVKIISVQRIEPEGLRSLAPSILTLARSIEVRTNG